jgi:phenylacetate-coenzyme A ligase PaaK-like adenylate-forming protein
MQDPFSIETPEAFLEAALETFHFQVKHNALYQQFLNYLKIDVRQVQTLEHIPFLPISFFKTHQVRAFQGTPEIVFSSSATTGSIQSFHEVYRLDYYQKSFRKAFQRAYGNLENTALLALLPSYAERQGSSLIYMVDDLIKQSDPNSSGYYLYNHRELADKLIELKKKGQRTILLGVSFALLDFTDQYSFDFPELIVIETGGMKGRRKEIIREDLHHQLKAKFGVKRIHSEYGMTELLSQAYMQEEVGFQCPPWMKVLIRDPNDPFSYLPKGLSGGINVIDLANRYSCAFIATQDLGKLKDHDTFEVLGRFDASDIRGCNLLAQ